MKKILLISILTFSIITGFAQSPWWVGGHLGVNFSTITGQYDDNQNVKHTFIATPLFGAVGMYSVNDMISVVAEINVAGSGALYKIDVDNLIKSSVSSSSELKYKFCYTNLQIPILVKFTFGNDWQYFGYGGFYWSYKLGGKYKIKSDNFDDEDGKIKFGDAPDGYDGDDWYMDTDHNRRTDFGLNIGGGVQKELGPGVIAADLRFGFGFLDSNKWPDDNQPDTYKAYRSVVIGLYISYLINLGN